MWLSAEWNEQSIYDAIGVLKPIKSESIKGFWLNPHFFCIYKHFLFDRI